MPAISSSSRGGTMLRLFASERNALITSHDAAGWIADNSLQNEELLDAAVGVQHAIDRLLKLLPSQERNGMA
jgi:hypothetical protein